MPSSSPKKIRKQLYEDFEDSLFKLVMHDASEKQGQLFLEEKEKLKDDPEYCPSQEAVQKFSRQLDARLKKTKAYSSRQHYWPALNRVAIAMFIILAILGTTVVTVEAVRIKALNFLMEIQKEYTSFELKDSVSQSPEEFNNSWQKAYAPTYIPPGYEVSAVSSGELSKSIEFQNPQGSIITFLELGQGNKAALDTENASAFKKIDINGYEGRLVVKNSLVTVIWSIDDRMFMIRGEMDEETAVKMAEGVKYLDGK